MGEHTTEEKCTAAGCEWVPPNGNGMHAWEYVDRVGKTIEVKRDGKWVPAEIAGPVRRVDGKLNVTVQFADDIRERESGETVQISVDKTRVPSRSWTGMIPKFRNKLIEEREYIRSVLDRVVNAGDEKGKEIEVNRNGVWVKAVIVRSANAIDKHVTVRFVDDAQEAAPSCDEKVDDVIKAPPGIRVHVHNTRTARHVHTPLKSVIHRGNETNVVGIAKGCAEVGFEVGKLGVKAAAVGVVLGVKAAAGTAKVAWSIGQWSYNYVKTKITGSTQQPEAPAPRHEELDDERPEFLPCDRDDLNAGTQVEVHSPKEAKDLNGALARVVGKDVEDPTRYAVEIIHSKNGEEQYDPEELVSLTPENIRIPDEEYY